MDQGMILIAFGASLGAGLMTGLGALPVLFVRKLRQATEDALLGFAAGVMLAASFFSLIVPGLNYARDILRVDRPTAAAVVLAAVLLGAAALFMVNHVVPHEHFVSGRQGSQRIKAQRIWLFIIAITLHNFPEGLAVGAGFGGGDLAAGTKLAIAIGLQNAPEGLSVAVALVALGHGRLHALLIATATGLVEPVGGLISIAAISLAQELLPWALGFAAGAMLFVISNEIIPETHRSGHENIATAGLMIGVVAMTFLDNAFG
jgi:ZIP family zinc transporter